MTIEQINQKVIEKSPIIDDVINEPLIGAHRSKDEAIKALADYFLESVKELRDMSQEERYEKRYQKLMSLGSFSQK